MRNPETAHWRDSARTPKFFMIDAYSAIPLFLTLLHIRLWTIMLTSSVCVFFMILNRFGFTLPVFLRLIRSFFAGNNRIARPWRRTDR